jgi:4-hydroxy-tetrahydrodipicolinate reductase
MSATRIVVVGAMGRMGVMVREAIARDADLTVGGALERPGHPDLGSDVGGTELSDDPKTAISSGDVVVDFSLPESTAANMQVAADLGVAYVTGTTGFDAEGLRKVREHAERIPIVHAPNFSLAVNVLTWLVREAASKLGDGFDAELFELHHSAKRDAPSGTALRLAEAVAEGREQSLDEHLLLERAGDVGARRDGTIAVQTLRGGDNPGEHSVLFVGRGERIELVHRSATREHFAEGAVRAARWLVGREPGLYPVEEIFGLASAPRDQA